MAGMGQGVFAFKGGEKFSRWTVLHYSREEKKYLCQCDCGTYRYIRQNSLKSGKSNSCGCHVRDKRQTLIEDSDYAGVKNHYYLQYRNAARRRGIVFLLEKEDFSKLIFDNCHYCGTAPHRFYTYGKAKHNPVDFSKFKVNGIDRLDSEQAYYTENCVTACETCNKAKLCMTKDEFLSWIARVYRHNFKDQND